MSKNVICYTVIVICLFTSACFAKYSGGNGTAEHPYLIATPNDLNTIGLDSNDWDKHFKMVADVNLAGFSGSQFNIIGSSYLHFTGVFDGNEHNIHRFTYLAEDSTPVGLFGSVSGEHITIKNLTLSDVNIVGDQWVGALVGVLHGGISGCSVISGRISGMDMVGGLVGLSEPNGSYSQCISDCYAIADVQGGYGVGGLVGYSHWSIDGCFSAGSVTGGDRVGGLTGAHYRLGSISNCYSFSNVNGNEGVGGLIGHAARPVEYCYSSGIVDGNDLVGAFTGWKRGGTFSSCFWNIDLNLDVNGIGEGTDSNVIGLTTVQMQQRSTFTDAGWDMVNVWDIGENQTYPFLRTHLPSDINKDDETNFLDLAVLTDNWLGEK